MLGIDIYERYQDVTDWGAVARHGVRFCWVKASDGATTFRNDPTRRPDALVAGARSVGIAVGLYHYAQLTPAPETQADVLIGEVRRLQATGLPPALDLEAPFKAGPEARDFAIRFLRRIVEHHGMRPAIYANTSMLAGIRPDTWGIPGLLIWAADYGANNGQRNPDLRPYTGRADVHQYTSVGAIAGIVGRVDLNESLTNILQGGAPDMDWSDQIEHPHVPDPARPGRGKLIVAKDALLLGNDAAQRAEAGVNQLRQQVAKMQDTLARIEQIIPAITRQRLLPHGEITFTSATDG